MPEGERDTICISSQVGCPVDCKFCMTALLGLERNLTAGEIVGQVLLVARDNGLLEDGGAQHRDDGAGRAAAESGRTW
jgi:adenine C2-methylase RlmN of 23S rRNA A2503 and tRNA A37